MELKYPFSEVRAIWMDGEMVPFADARTHVLSHALHYGSAIFEGIRAYETPSGAAVFRLRAHLERLLRGCRVYRFEVPHDLEALESAVLDTLRFNALRTSYIRPLVYRGFASMRMDPRPCPTQTMIAAWPSKSGFLSDEVFEKGISVGISSWRRMAPGSLPVNVKAAGNYLNSQLITMEAHDNGFDEGIGLDANGCVSEGAADNLFMVSGGELITPPVSASILLGITRDCVLTLAADLGIPVRQEAIPRGALYEADEVFLTGTSVEISPVSSVDRVRIGDGKPGPIAKRLLDEYLAIAKGTAEDRHGWLTPVPVS